MLTRAGPWRSSSEHDGVQQHLVSMLAGRGVVVGEEMLLRWCWRSPRHEASLLWVPPTRGSPARDAGHGPKSFAYKHSGSFGSSFGLHELNADCSGMHRTGNTVGASSPQFLGGSEVPPALGECWLEEQQHCRSPGMEVQHLPHQQEQWTLSGLLCCLKTGKVWIMKILNMLPSTELQRTFVSAHCSEILKSRFWQETFCWHRIFCSLLTLK